MAAVRQLRLVVTVEDFDAALAFYRDALGLETEAVFSSPGGRIVLLDAGRATLELTDATHAAYIDEVEVGRRVAGPIRVAFEVDDSQAATDALVAAGATLIAPADRDAVALAERAAGGPDLQLTLFQALEPE